MNLGELRSHTLAFLDDVQGDVFAVGGLATRLDQLINHSYEKLVNELELSSRPYNITAVPIEVSVSSAAREYVLEPPEGQPAIRRVVDVVRTDTTVPTPIPLVSHATREYSAGPAQGQPWSSAAYVYRRADGDWVLGFMASEPVTQTVQVRYEPVVELLESAESEPVQMLPGWHRLIALQAALLGKIQENRDASGLGALYAEELMQFRQETGRLTHAGSSRPL